VVVTLHRDDSISVQDNGRGTQVRYDEAGRPTVKPVMSTKDLRFFDVEGAPILPDGHARFGISVVAALSEWITHTNRREDGAWTQRYERGLPVGPLTEAHGGASTGTIVRFRPDPTVFGIERASVPSLNAACAPFAATVDLEIVDETAN
jgi:topoisomerase-4 subunit B